jgi:hypothetical protein
VLNQLSAEPRRRMRGVVIEIHVVLTAVLAGVEWSAARQDRFTPWKTAHGIQFIRG